MIYINEMYQANIINQQISYYILQEEYNKLNGKYIYESGEGWLKEKINKFVSIIKTWIEKIKTFITKTLPAWFVKIKNSLLKLLGFKKGKEITPEKVKEDAKADINKTVNSANTATKTIIEQTAKTNIDDKKDATDNELIKKATLIKNNAIEKIKEHVKKNDIDMASGQAIIKAIESNMCVYMKYGKSENRGLTGTMIPLDIMQKAISASKDVVDFFCDSSTEIISDIDKNVDPSIQAEDLDFNQANENFEVPDIEELKGKRQEILIRSLDDLSDIISATISKQKIIDSVKSKTNTAISNIDQCGKKMQNTQAENTEKISKTISLINLAMKNITNSYNQMVSFYTLCTQEAKNYISNCKEIEKK